MSPNQPLVIYCGDELPLLYLSTFSSVSLRCVRHLCTDPNPCHVRQNDDESEPVCYQITIICETHSISVEYHVTGVQIVFHAIQQISSPLRVISNPAASFSEAQIQPHCPIKGREPPKPCLNKSHLLTPHPCKWESSNQGAPGDSG